MEYIKKKKKPPRVLISIRTPIYMRVSYRQDVEEKKSKKKRSYSCIKVTERSYNIVIYVYSFVNSPSNVGFSFFFFNDENKYFELPHLES